MAAQPTALSISFSALIALHDQGIRMSENAKSLSNDQKLLDELFHSTFLPTSQSLNLVVQSVSDLIERLIQSVGTESTKPFLSWLNSASSSIDALQDFMATCQQALSTYGGSIDPQSMVGTYLWSVCLGFDQLDFYSTTRLWQIFKEEIELIDLDGIVSMSVEDKPIQQKNIIPASFDQLAEVLQNELELGILSKKSKEIVQRILERHPEFSLGLFATFLTSLQSGDVEAADNALHQYLDYSDGNTSSLRFVAILYTLMFNHFGKSEMASMACEEAIRVAQQSHDTDSVAFALGWLAELHLSGGHESDGEGSHTLKRTIRTIDFLQRCVKRACENNLRNLSVGAKLLQSSVISVATNHTQELASSWILLQQALCEEPTGDGSGSSFDRPSYIAHFTNAYDALRLIERQRLVAAGIWSRLGEEALSSMALRTVLQHERNKFVLLSEEDKAVAILNLAMCSLHSWNSEGDDLEKLSEELAGSAMQKQLGHSQKQFDRKLFLSDLFSPLYSKAIQSIVRLRTFFRLPETGAILQGIGLLIHECAVYRGEIRRAETLAHALACHICPRLSGYRDFLLDVKCQNSFRLSRQGRLDDAVVVLEYAITQCQSTNDAVRHCRLLLQMSRCMLESNPSNFTRALKPLLECMALADASSLNGVHAAALSLLGQVHLRMNHPKRATAVVQASLPTLLENEHVWYQGEAYLTLSKCQLHLAQKEYRQSGAFASKSLPRLVLNYVQAASDYLKKCEELFRCCEDCPRLRETYYLQARIYDSLCKTDLRDTASTKFVVVSRHLERANVRAVQL